MFKNFGLFCKKSQQGKTLVAKDVAAQSDRGCVREETDGASGPKACFLGDAPELGGGDWPLLKLGRMSSWGGHSVFWATLVSVLAGGWGQSVQILKVRREAAVATPSKAARGFHLEQ